MIGDGVLMMNLSRNLQRNTDNQVKKDRVPPLSIQYDKGRYAFTRGWIANPYDEDEAKGKEWQRGFNAAYFDNLDKVKARYAKH